MPGRRGKPNEIVRTLERIRARQERGDDTLEAFAERIGVGISTYLSWRDNRPPRIPERATMRLVYRSLEAELAAEGYDDEDAWLAVRDRLDKRRRGGLGGGTATAAAIAALFIPTLHNATTECRAAVTFPGLERRGLKLATAARRGRRNSDKRGSGRP